MCTDFINMKTKIFTVALLMGLTTTLFGQNAFNNGGFENWEDKGDYQDPTYWSTLNKLVGFGYEPSTTLTTDAKSGTNAVMLRSQANAFQNIPGVLATGPVINQANEPDFTDIKIAFAARPKSIQFYYKYAPSTNDSCVFYAVLTKWNTSTNKTDTIAKALFTNGSAVNAYTMGEAVFNYNSTEQPDSAFMLITSSVSNLDPIVGSTLFIDDLVLVYNTGLSNVVNNTLSKVYPNPTQNIITISTQNNKIFEVVLTDINGKEITKLSNQINQTHLDLSGLNNGLYFLRTISSDGTSVQKIVKN